MPLTCALARATLLDRLQVVKLLELVPLHRFSSMAPATPPPSASGMKSQSMLPDPSSRNMTLGLTTELAVFAIGEPAISVSAALTEPEANPIARTSPICLNIEPVGEVLFMIAPVCTTYSIKSVDKGLEITDGEMRSLNHRGDAIEHQRNSWEA